LSAVGLAAGGGSAGSALENELRALQALLQLTQGRAPAGLTAGGCGDKAADAVKQFEELERRLGRLSGQVRVNTEALLDHKGRIEKLEDKVFPPLPVPRAGDPPADPKKP
ncbi:MAG: hypothetical protein K2X87_19780, partial [Gemmataceae bacterium]|nr:hypothetical protein [Gemmataceae bacterium]